MSVCVCVCVCACVCACVRVPDKNRQILQLHACSSQLLSLLVPITEIFLHISYNVGNVGHVRTGVIPDENRQTLQLHACSSQSLCASWLFHFPPIKSNLHPPFCTCGTPVCDPNFYSDTPEEGEEVWSATSKSISVEDMIGPSLDFLLVLNTWRSVTSCHTNFTNLSGIVIGSIASIAIPDAISREAASAINNFE